MLSADQKEQVPVRGNQGTEHPQSACLHEFFEEQVERTPSSVAVLFEAQRLTYSELNGRANQLARYLRQQGVGPEVLVGICVERSLEMVVGLLGILKAGAAYVPLDPEYPHERLSFMLQDSRVPVLLVQQRLVPNVPPCEAQQVCLDSDWKKIAQESDCNLEATVTADNPAYVIYTSGSTGRPKGAVITHRAIINHMLWMQQEFPLNSDDRVLQKTPISFDASVWEFFAPLMAGSQLVMAWPGGHRETAYLVATLQRYQVTILQLVPSLLRFLLDEPGFENCRSLRRVYCGGEQLPVELTKRFISTFESELVNLYGPTEASIDSTYWRCEAGKDEQIVPIGRPITNMQTYILNSRLQPVVDGEPGELCIGGEGLARGYLNRPDLTAEKFIPSPFSGHVGTRLYRTGDLARFRSDGAIEYLGRTDHQVKVRGFRIELGEIESVIREHEAVKECVVTARENKRGERQIVAYLVPGRNEISAADGKVMPELRRFLKKRLPDYMMPAAFITLNSLPLLPNGKLDRNALPEPDDARPDLESDYIAARDGLEQQLVTLCEQVLSIKSIGIDDDFFELGGDSLSGSRLFAQIEQSFNKKLPLATLFQASTIRGLANLLRDGWSPSWSSLVAIQPNGSRRPLYCVHACGAHVFIYRPLVRHLRSDQPVYGLQAQGIDGKEEPFKTVPEMARHYVKEIREFQPEGPYFLLGDTLGGLFAFEMALELHNQGQQVALLAMLDTLCPLKPSFGRRLRCHLKHLRQQGTTTYLSTGMRAFNNRLRSVILRKPMGNYYLPIGDFEAAQETLDLDDPVVRTEMAIYQAAHVEYLPFKIIYPGKITYFLAQESSYENRYEDNRLDWRKLAAEYEVHQIPGGHDTIKEEPYVAALAEKLTLCLQQAQNAHL